jgi:hypothetical protein
VNVARLRLGRRSRFVHGLEVHVSAGKARGAEAAASDDLEAGRVNEVAGRSRAKTRALAAIRPSLVRTAPSIAPAASRTRSIPSTISPSRNTIPP